MPNQQFHKPVLIREVLEYLKPQNDEVYIDGTFGAGGYTSAILESAKCKVYSFDRDITVKKFADKIKEKFQDNFHFIHNRFSEMKNEMSEIGVEQVDGIVLDLGVSSMQLDQKERGFSFDSTTRLDMRMDASSGISAFEVVNQSSEEELAKIIWEFGDERKSRQIAKKIVENRKLKPITNSDELANIVRSICGYKKGQKIDPATKTFQAIRIFVNDELGELEAALKVSSSLLRKGGRLIIVSFHSLEDSYVKNFLRQESGYNDRNSSRYAPPTITQDKKHNFTLAKNSVIKPKDDELKNNIRARSSRMRVAIKN